MKHLFVFIILLFVLSCSSHELAFDNGSIKVEITEGSEWIHPYPLFLGIKKDNPPQFALWVEDLDGNYLATLLVTEKVGLNNWQANGGNRRIESLPTWTFSRNIKDNDGTYMPSNDNPVSDGITTATPKEGFTIGMEPISGLRSFVLNFEVNHSIDFNKHYPESAKPGDKNYSGGSDGSGQPALLYSKVIDLDKSSTWELDLIGHSSPDGSTNEITKDLSSITTAKKIIESIKVFKVEQ